jgi:hypothetical protein
MAEVLPPSAYALPGSSRSRHLGRFAIHARRVADSNRNAHAQALSKRRPRPWRVHLPQEIPGPGVNRPEIAEDDGPDPQRR